MTWLQRFLPDQVNRRLAQAFLAFCVAALGGVINVAGWLLEARWLSVLGFWVAAAGVLLGFVAIAVAQVSAARQIVRKLRGSKQ
jgi:hypothetical protein